MSENAILILIGFAGLFVALLAFVIRVIRQVHKETHINSYIIYRREEPGEEKQEGPIKVH